MSVERKSHDLDESLLHRARRVLAVSTETEAIHAALRAVVDAEDVLRDLDAARASKGRSPFRDDFARAMRAERRAAK